MDDRQLVDRFIKSRSEKIFLQLYNHHAIHLDRIAMVLCDHDKRLAQDSLQETWITAIKKLPDFEWRSKFRTWIVGILINSIRKGKRSEVNSLNIDDIKELNYISDYATIYDLKRAIKSLPQGYKEVLTLHDIEGFKHKEIAAMLEINEGTSKSQLHYARKAVRIYLKDIKPQPYE